jgi:hypothetical protein
VVQIHNLVRVNRKDSTVETIWDSSIYDPKYIHFGGKNVLELPNDMDEFRKLIVGVRNGMTKIFVVPQTGLSFLYHI